MAIDINKVKLQVEDIARKDQTTGYITPARFNRASLLALKEEVNHQRGIFESDSTNSDILSDLKVITSYSVGSDGRVTKPTDYSFFSAAYNNVFIEKGGESKFVTKPIDLITDAELGIRKNSELRPPTKRKPVVIEYDGYFQFYPSNLLKVDLTYIKTPADPVWGFTVVSGRDVYDESTSVNFDLPDHLFGSIVYRICKQLGIETATPDLYQASQMALQAENKD